MYKLLQKVANKLFSYKVLIIFIISALIFLLSLTPSLNIWRACRNIQYWQSCNNQPSCSPVKEIFQCVPFTTNNPFFYSLTILGIFTVLFLGYLFLKLAFIPTVRYLISFLNRNRKSFVAFSLTFMAIALVISTNALNRYLFEIPTLLPALGIENALWSKGCHEQPGFWSCAGTEIEEKFGCVTIYTTSINTTYNSYNFMPLYKCLDVKAPQSGLYPVGCNGIATAKYIYQLGDSLAVIQNSSDLGVLFQEIKTPDAAILFAQLATGNQVWENSNIPYGAILKDPTTRKVTLANETSGGFEVNLFHTDPCVCNEKSETEIIYEITSKAEIKIKEERELYTYVPITSCFL